MSPPTSTARGPHRAAGESSPLLAALALVRRGGVLPDGASPLLDTLVKGEAASALRACRGPAVTSATPFPSTVWYGGATDTLRGNRFKGTVGDFVEHVLRARSAAVAPKREGWVVTPTVNADGQRRNVSTTAVCALNLDCDGLGSWDAFLGALRALGVAHVAYQSGGFTSKTPKWHALVPLAAPFDTSSPDKVDAWRRAYALCRTVFGALADLPREGFDATTDAPSVPVFITERRAASDAPREVVFAPGDSLDLGSLAALYPEAFMAPPRVAAHRDVMQAEALDDDRLEAVVSTLTPVMSAVHAGRRDLYLALPGALLDRGVLPDDVLAICEAVSERYPRPDETRHKDNLRAARTTVARFENDLDYTRIGTIAGRWPDVARALDKAFPEYTAARLAEMRAETDKFLERVRVKKRGVVAATASPTKAPEVPLRVVSPSEVADNIRAASRRLRQLKDFHKKVRGCILLSVADGEDLVPRDPDDGTPANDARGEPYNRSSATADAAYSIGSSIVPLETPFLVVREVMRKSVTAMLVEGESTKDLFDVAEQAFERGLKSRTKRLLDDEERARVRRQINWGRY